MLVTVDDLQELVKLLAKFIATQKTANLQRSCSDAHALLVKWNKFQKMYKNRIQHFLPRIGDHPDVILHGVITDWDPKAKNHDGQDVDIPVNFPPDILRKYRDWNSKYVPSAPVKTEEAQLLMKIVPLDVRFLLGCGLKWDANATEPEDTSASGGAAPAAPSDSHGNADRSPSPQPKPSPLDIVSWDPIMLETIPFDDFVFPPDIEFTKFRPYHAMAILFFLHPELPVKYPEMKDAVHAGWMATFKHPMNFDELRRPPCVGEGAYTEEEQEWCAATITYLVDNLDANGRQSRGIPESAVSRRTRPRNAAASAAASKSGPTAAAGPRSGPAPAAAAAKGRGGGGGGGAAGACAVRGRASARTTVEEASQDLANTESENDLVETTKTRSRKRVRSQSR